MCGGNRLCSASERSFERQTVGFSELLAVVRMSATAPNSVHVSRYAWPRTNQPVLLSHLLKVQNTSVVQSLSFDSCSSTLAFLQLSNCSRSTPLFGKDAFYYHHVLSVEDDMFHFPIHFQIPP